MIIFVNFELTSLPYCIPCKERVFSLYFVYVCKCHLVLYKHKAARQQQQPVCYSTIDLFSRIDRDCIWICTSINVKTINLYFSNKSIKTSTFDIEVVKRSLSTFNFPPFITLSLLILVPLMVTGMVLPNSRSCSPVACSKFENYFLAFECKRSKVFHLTARVQ